MAGSIAAVLDATPCISLYRLGLQELLTRPFDQVYLPTTVLNELLAGVQHDEAYRVVLVSKVSVRGPGSAQLPADAEFLDEGERAVLRLARSIDAQWVVIDEMRGRRVARSMGFRVVGSLGLIARATHDGVLERARPYFARLRESTFRAPLRLYNEILAQLGEPPLPPHLPP